MCDCYLHMCHKRGCRDFVQMHIEDFEEPRRKFRVWCKKHVAYAHPDARVYVDVKNQNKKDSDTCAILGPECGTPNSWKKLTQITVDQYRCHKKGQRWKGKEV